jgi:D-alanyl-D-alanine carboxypeptidase-like protein
MGFGRSGWHTRSVRRLLPLLLAALLGACSTASDTGRSDPSGPPAATASGSTGQAAEGSPPVPVEVSPSPDQADAPDGVGQVRTRFAGRISPLPAPLAAEMRGTTWKPGCPVPLSGLSLLRFNYWGFGGEVKRGPMVVNDSVASDVLWVFGRLFQARFPLKRVGLTREFKESELETDPNTRRSVTASFNCRPVVTPAGAGDTFSQHSFGLAVDVNPLRNPYVRADGWVRNRFARPYVDRSRNLPGMIEEDDVVVRSFAAIGWAWGGHWSGGKDYMHFSRAGT